MRRLTIIFQLIIIITSAAVAQWNIQLDTENFTNLDRIFFIDEADGWAIGGHNFAGEGPYYYTEDGGENWYLDPNWYNADYWGTDIVFVNHDTGFIAGINGKIHKTLDGGHNWIPIQTPATQNIIKLFFFDENNGWATLGQYSSGNILQTIDGGNTWDIKPILYDCYDNVCNLFFINENIGWISGFAFKTNNEDYSFIKKTANSGQNWLTLDSIVYTPYYYSDIFFIDSINGWIVGQQSGNEYLVLNTADGGETWSEQYLEEDVYYPPKIANCVFFANDTVGWIGTGEPCFDGHGAIYLTKNGGEDWLYQWSWDDYGIFDIQMLDQDTGWAAAGHFIFHTFDGDTIIYTGLNEIKSNVFSLDASPNPTTGTFNLNFNGDHHDAYNLVVSNPIGQTVFIKEQITTDQLNNISIDISGYPCGVYLVIITPESINTKNKNIYLTQKIIKL